MNQLVDIPQRYAELGSMLANGLHSNTVGGSVLSVNPMTGMLPRLVRIIILGIGGISQKVLPAGMVQLTDYGRCVVAGCGCRVYTKTKVNLVCACGHRRERHNIVYH